MFLIAYIRVLLLYDRCILNVNIPREMHDNNKLLYFMIFTNSQYSKNYLSNNLKI